MKRWMAALLAFTLLMSAVPVPAFAQAWQTPEVHIHEVQAQTEEPEVPTEEEVPETPTEPEEPTEPETPTDPEEPTDPEVPEDKEEPAECEHQYESVVTEPGCTQGGYTTHKCVLCGHTYTDNYTEPRGCILSWVEPVEPTCTQEGVKGFYLCSQCLEQFWDPEGQQLIVNTRELLIPKVPHTMEEWEILVPSTPDALGIKVRKCEYCDYNEEAEADPLPETLTAPKVEVEISDTTGKPTLSWEKVADAKAYWIYLYDEETETRENLDITEKTEYTHEEARPGEAHHYLVIAANDEACSPVGEVEHVIPKCAKPVLKMVRDSVTGKPLATWESVEGAVAYELYRSSDKNNFERIATVEGNSYLVEDAVVDKTHHYKLKAVGTVSEGDSVFSSVVSHTCDCARPVPVAVPGENGGIRISWDKIQGGKKYTVYRSDREDGTYKVLTTTGALSYTDKKAPKNQISYYKVDVYGATTASFSDYSEVVWAVNHTFGSWKTVTPATPETEGWKERICTHCGQVEGKSVPVLQRSLGTPKVSIKTNSNGKPVLSWGSVRNATAYQVYQVVEGQRIFLAEMTAKSYTHKEAVTGNPYTYQVIAVSATKCSDYSEPKRILCICGVPQLKLVRDSVTGKPIATWEPVEGAVSYELYRSANNRSYERIATVEGNSYLVEDAVVGKTHSYKVKAIGSSAELDSAQSGAVSHTCDCARPVAVAESGEDGGIRISWNRVEGGKKYTLYRSDKEDGTYKKVTTTGALSYTDKKAPKNQISYYKVDVYGASTASFSDYSEPVWAVNHSYGSWKTIVPSTPESEGLQQRQCTGCDHTQTRVIPKLTRSLKKPNLSVKTDDASGKPVLSWGSVKGATAYQVYTLENGQRTFLEEVGTRSYTHREAVTGNPYTYQVIAVSTTKCSDYSEPKSILCVCGIPQLKLVRDSVSGKPIATWEPVEGAVSYELYRSANKRSYERIATVEGNSYLVEDAVVGKTHSYKVKAIGSSAELDSALGAAVSHTCDCARPVAAAESGEDGGIKISWNKVEGGKKYTLYRSDKEDGTYKKIATTGALSYTDKKAPKNQISYYKVDVYGATTASYSDYSEPVWALNHTYGSWKTIVPSTDREEGWQERVCSGCGDVQGKVKPVLKRTLTTPTLSVEADSTSGKPVLSWNSVRKAEEYWVYLCDREADVFLGAARSRTFTHSDAIPGVEYTYRVMAVNETACGSLSAEKAVLCRCAIPELRLHNDPDTGMPIASWDRVEGAGAYELYWSRKESGSYTLYTATTECDVLIDQALGGKYYYRIKALHESNPDADSKMSQPRANVCKCRRPEAVMAGIISDTCNKVFWTPVAGATKYEIYRAAAEDGTYTRIGTSRCASYLDTGVSADSGIWFYQVAAMAEEDNTLSARSEAAAADIPSAQPIKIYISPSSQTDNPYPYGKTTEAKECRAIGVFLQEALERCGFETLINVKEDMYYRVPESNAWGADIHVAVHTNAFNGSARGTQIYFGDAAGKKLSNAIFDRLAPVVPGSGADSVRKDVSLYEVNASNATVSYIEAAFHDSEAGAKWIINNKQKIAEAICRGICDRYGVTYIAP